jgi:hypothetical protein
MAFCLCLLKQINVMVFENRFPWGQWPRWNDFSVAKDPKKIRILSIFSAYTRPHKKGLRPWWKKPRVEKLVTLSLKTTRAIESGGVRLNGQYSEIFNPDFFCVANSVPDIQRPKRFRIQITIYKYIRLQISTLAYAAQCIVDFYFR